MKNSSKNRDAHKTTKKRSIKKKTINNNCIKYNRHNVSCKVCMNYEKSNNTCYALVRNYSNTYQFNSQKNKELVTNFIYLKMFSSVLSNMKIIHEDIYPSTLIKMNKDYKCPFNNRVYEEDTCQ